MAYKIEHGTYNIDIRLDNGLYRMPFYSADGKSRMAQLINDLTELGYNVFAIDPSKYAGYKQAGMLPKNAEVYFLDRYDNYGKEVKNQVIELSKHAIVMIDTKMRDNIPKDTKMCALVMMSPEHIIVVGGEQ